MNIVCLLSAGRHPVSCQPVLPRLEAQMIRVAQGVGGLLGLHAGPDASTASEALGHGLATLDHLRLREGQDPVDALVGHLLSVQPDIILAGRRGQGGDETGLLPYLVAKRLGAPLVPDVIALRKDVAPDVVEIEQALAKGARRRLRVRLPLVATVHPAAPPPRPFAYGQMRRGVIRTVETFLGEPAAVPACEVRPFKPRPKLMPGAPTGATAAERLLAATGSARSDGAQVLDRPDPEIAARAILDHLRRIGIRAPVPSSNRIAE